MMVVVPSGGGGPRIEDEAKRASSIQAWRGVPTRCRV